MRRCLDCPTDLSGRPHAKYCDDCRWRHRGKPAKYVFDATKDAYLREHYTGERGTAARIGALWGYPSDAIRNRATRLGLARPRMRNGHPEWTIDETLFLQQHAARRHPEWLARTLSRSVTAIVVKMKRLRLSRLPDGYTQGQVAEGLGVKRDTVERWQRLGWLRSAFTPRDGQPYRFTEAEIVAFLREHRQAYDLRKVDQLWFLDLTFGETVTRAEAAA